MAAALKACSRDISANTAQNKNKGLKDSNPSACQKRHVFHTANTCLFVSIHLYMLLIYLVQRLILPPIPFVYNYIFHAKTPFIRPFCLRSEVHFRADVPFFSVKVIESGRFQR